MRLRSPCLVAMLAALASPGEARAQAPSPPAAASTDDLVREVAALEGKRQRLTDGARYEEAIEVVLQLVPAMERLRGADHLDALTRRLWLAGLQANIGAWAAAEAQYTGVIGSLERIEKQTGARYGIYRGARASLADLYVRKGDPERAVPACEILLAEARAREPPAPTEVASAERNLAAVYRAMGLFDRAEPLLLHALELVRTHGEPAQRGYQVSLDDRGGIVSGHDADSRVRAGEAALLTDLARLFLDQGDLAEAETHASRALATCEEAPGPESRCTATALLDLGSARVARGDAAGAEQAYARSLALREKIDGVAHLQVATVLHSWARLRLARGDAAGALAFARRALAVIEPARGPEHRQTADVLVDVADALTALGRLAEALPLYDRAAQIRDRDAALVLSVGSDAQKRALWARQKRHLDARVSLSALSSPGDAGAAELALRTLLRTKGSLLDVTAGERTALRRRLDADDQALFDRLARVDGALSAGAALGGDFESTPEGRARLERLTGERGTLERSIADRSADFRAAERLLTVEDVKRALPADAALIELVSYRPFLLPGPNEHPTATAVPWGEPRYAAFVVRRGSVAVVDLGPSTAIDTAVAGLGAALGDADLSRDPKPLAKAAYNSVVAPLVAHLAGVSHVITSPDGALSLVPFEAFADETGHYLVERYLFTYVESGSRLVRSSAHAAPGQGPLVLADPDFGPLAGVPFVEAARRSGAAIDMGKIGFLPLPGTAKEAHAVQAALGGGRVLVGLQASESALKSAHAPSVLHVATHGFFLPGAEPDAGPRAPGIEPTGAELASWLRAESPLLRSGIALSSANLRRSGTEDGILTAFEASSLDLDGTELVVLSACETGLGAAVSGDGVYGMRRALSIAGAETLVMSLWQVDTGRTRELMVHFYEGLASGLGRSEALRQAQLAMLGQKATAHPNLWAAFISSGRWEPLSSVHARAVPPVTPGARGCGCEVAGRGSSAAGLFVLLAVAGAARLRRQARLGRRSWVSAGG